MKHNAKLRIEEYVPAATFLNESFSTDRSLLEVKFPKFTAEFAKEFEDKITNAKKLDSAIVLTKDQKNTTQILYQRADNLNKNLNYLSFYYKDVQLDTKFITKIKRYLTSRNIEGACLQLNDIIQHITANKDLLELNGMPKDFMADLLESKAELEEKNATQNKNKDAVKILYENNRAVYDDLNQYITTICNAGKLLFQGQVKAEQYTLSKLIGRMRSYNSGKTTNLKIFEAVIGN